MERFDTTIAAPATAVGGAIAIVRLSGARAYEITKIYFSGELKDRYASFGLFRGEDGDMVDEVLCTYFAAPRSYTGEDCIEISCHGSAWIVGEIMRLLLVGGAVTAGAGEFSRRAFANGKLDLSQAEAVADLIVSNSAASARIALQQMRGGYRVALSGLKEKLLHITSLLTLELDFSEEDVQFADRRQLTALLCEIIDCCERLCASFRAGNALKNGVSVAIVGAPNVGKSTLLNALVGEQRSIVSAVAGTTRDYVEQSFTIDGVCFRFIDTAGIREQGEIVEEIENEGIRRSHQQASVADIVLYLTAGGDDSALAYDDCLRVYSKCDTYTERLPGGVYISARTGEGMDHLRAKLVEMSGVHTVRGEQLTITNARHYEALSAAAASFSLALEAMSDGSEPDKICASLNDGLSHLSSITGEITTPEILANIFSHFCIGK